MTTLSFIIPVYNEEERLKKTFRALRCVKLPKGLTLTEITFVNDGSTDGTKSHIKQFINRHSGKVALGDRIQNFPRKRSWTSQDDGNTKMTAKIKFLSYERNMGKGYAIRQGMRYSDADYTLFFDADISTPLSEIAKLLPSLEKGVDVIIGTRKNGKSTVIKHQPFYREFLGRGFTKMTQLLLGVHVTDFTCGFKAFSKKARLTIFSDAQINGWGYDAELLYLAKKNALSMQEVPVTWSNDARSKVKLYKDVPKSLFDLITILWVHKFSWYALHLPRNIRLFLLQKYA